MWPWLQYRSCNTLVVSDLFRLWVKIFSWMFDERRYFQLWNALVRPVGHFLNWGFLRFTYFIHSSPFLRQVNLNAADALFSASLPRFILFWVFSNAQYSGFNLSVFELYYVIKRITLTSIFHAYSSFYGR